MTTPVETTATTSIPTSTTTVTWSSEQDVLTSSPEQALPSVDEVRTWVAEENLALGATDNIVHPASGVTVGSASERTGCSQAGFVSLEYNSSGPLTEVPNRGIGPVSLTTHVCDSEDALSALDTQWIGFADLGQGPCPVDERTGEPIVVICPVQPGETVQWLNVTAIAHRGLIAVTVSLDVGRDSDPVEVAAAAARLLEIGLAPIDERLS